MAAKDAQQEQQRGRRRQASDAPESERAGTEYVVFRPVDPKTGEPTEDKTGAAWIPVGKASARRPRGAAENVARKGQKGGDEAAAEGIFLAIPSRYFKPFRLRKNVTVDYSYEEV